MLELADYAIRIEDHYSKLAGHPSPMDIEWAKDGEDGKLYIVQARPETVASQRRTDSFETYALKGTGPVLVSGRAVGEKIAAGAVRVVADKEGLAAFRPGEVLVAEATSPDWEPVMKTAGAIVTSRGGRTCHAAIVARELGVPAVVGAEGAVAEARDRHDRDGELRRRRDRQRLRRQATVRGRPASPIEHGAAAAHRDHGQSRQSRARLPHRDAAQ